MKIFNCFTRVSLVVAAGSLLIFVALTGCDSGNFPFAPETRIVAPQTISYDDFQPLKYDNVHLTLAAPVTVTADVTVRSGGMLMLNFKAGHSDLGDLDVIAKLKIPPDAVPSDMELAMAIDPDQFMSNMDVVFGPHGLEFTTPALLDIDVGGVDLTCVNIDLISVYYDNTDTSQWEKMDYKKLIINVDKGTIRLKDAKLPHFSRYALSKG